MKTLLLCCLVALVVGVSCEQEKKEDSDGRRDILALIPPADKLPFIDESALGAVGGPSLSNLYENICNTPPLLRVLSLARTNPVAALVFMHRKFDCLTHTIE